MSNIRRQSIISSLIIYFGFAVGLLNTYFFTKQGIFENSEFGLYNAFIAIATLMMAVSNMAMPSYIYKFFPYYKDHLEPKKNDQLSIAMVVALIGFLIVLVAGIIFKGVVVKKYVTNAPGIVTHYHWIFILGFGLLVFTILEAYAWQLHKSVFTNFLREVMWRLFTTGLICLFTFGVISNFDDFIRLFSFSYPFIALTLLLYLFFTGKLHFTFTISKLTRRFSGSIFKLCLFVYSGSLIFTLSLVFDSLVITSKLSDGLAWLAVYSVAQNLAAMIQVPQRGIVAASIAHLSRAWKEKQMGRIQQIYQRSSINQLIFACCILALMVLSFYDVVNSFGLKAEYQQAFYVVVLLGAAKVVDMGTGVNSQIIATSTYWRFEMISGVVLLLVMLPLSYWLTIEMGIRGTALAQLISISIYNLIRILFLWRKFRLFPFNRHTISVLALAGGCFAVCFFSFQQLHGWTGIFVRSAAFMAMYASAVILFRFSPDVDAVIKAIKGRLGFGKS